MMRLRALGNLSIAARAPLIAAGMMVLVGLVASQQVLSALTHEQEARLREIVRLHIDGLSVALGPFVLRQDIWEIYDTLDRAIRASEEQRMVLTVVADLEGRVIAATDPRRAPIDSALADLSAAQSVASLDLKSLRAGDRHVRVLEPLFFQGRQVGQILTELDVTDLARERRRAILALLVFNSVATGGLALVGFLAMRHMLRPISILTHYMGADSGKPVPIPDNLVPKGKTEVARLFTSYNEMTHAIEAKTDAERRLFERERLVSLGRLASSLAHEINNPLGGLLNAADTIETYSDRPEVVRQSAALLKSGLKHLRDVATAALDHNRLDRSGARLRPEDFDNVRLLISPEITRLRQDLRWETDVNPDQIAKHAAGPVRQIILNLVLNASRAAGASGTVGFQARTVEGELFLLVCDDGPGLPDAALQRLLSSELGQVSGGGVGLRVVRDLVLAGAGTITYARRNNMTEIVVKFARPDVVGVA